MSWWLLEAVWTEPTEPGLYSREGGPRATYADTRTFTDQRDAEAHRAAIRQAHPDATVTIRPTHGDRQTGPTRPADPTDPIRQARDVLDRSRR